MSARTRLAALLLAATTAGCTTSVAGSASPAAGSDGTPAPAGPFTTVRAELDLSAATGYSLFAVAPHPDGDFVALLGAGYDDEAWRLASVSPGPGGVELDDIRSFPPLGYDADLLVTADGTVVAAGTGSFADDGGLRIHLLRPGADEPDVVEVDGQRDPDTAHLAASPDGGTVYVAYQWYGAAGEDASNLAALDVATGEVLADVPIKVGAPAAIVDVHDLALRPDGGVTALVQASFRGGAREAAVYAVDFTADLEPAAQPVDLAPDLEFPFVYALAATAEGIVVPVGSAGPDGRAQTHLVVVRDGAVTSDATVPAGVPPYGMAGDPTGRSVFLPYVHGDGTTTIATVDLTTGRTVAEVALCVTTESFSELALAANGRSLAVAGTCDPNGPHSRAFVVG